MKVSGLIVGTRKAGTTWLYANLAKDKRFCVSEKVKESGFFAGSFGYDYDKYSDLYDCDDSSYVVEVDSSICYSDMAPEQINKFAPDAKIILVLRDPVEYLVSRYIHSTRKGEIKDKNMLDALRNNQWLRDELDYEKILDRFSSFNEKEQLLILPFTLLKENNIEFYNSTVKFITDSNESSDHVFISGEVNIARSSRIPFFSELLSNSAKFARKYNLHLMVNFAKKTGILRLLDSKVNNESRSLLLEESTKIINGELSSSKKIWEELQKKSNLV